MLAALGKHVPETVRAHDDTGMQYHSITNLGARIKRDARVEDTARTHLYAFAEKYPG